MSLLYICDKTDGCGIRAFPKTVDSHATAVQNTVTEVHLWTSSIQSPVQICGARLPVGNDPLSNPALELAASLGYRVQLVDLAARYLSAPLLHNAEFAVCIRRNSFFPSNNLRFRIQDSSIGKMAVWELAPQVEGLEQYMVYPDGRMKFEHEFDQTTAFSLLKTNATCLWANHICLVQTGVADPMMSQSMLKEGPSNIIVTDCASTG
ncbi:unnamed protein product [Sphagnum troendelagicum]|uniref:Uncharacterized protein n=1 Tax=Sphagnum troendelagicum TaxID=128251 RepID=A0ABP0TPC6_9BRYO